MSKLGRRSVLCGTAGLAAAATFARPFIANAQAKTATVLWVQGFVKEEDEAFKNMGAAYEKASGNKIELAGTADVSSWHSATCCIAPADGRFRIKADSRKSSSRTNLSVHALVRSARTIPILFQAAPSRPAWADAGFR